MGEIIATLDIAPAGRNSNFRSIPVLVDTGSSYTIIPSNLARRLGLVAVDQASVRTATEEVVPGRIVEADLRVDGARWMFRQLVFVPDVDLSEDPIHDVATGRMVTPKGLLGAMTLQSGPFVIDYRTHSVALVH